MKALKTVICILSALLLFCGTLASLLMAPMYFLTHNPSSLAKKICDEEYVSAVRENVKSNVEHSSMLMSLDSEVFIDLIDWDKVDTLSYDYMTWLCTKVLHGTSDDRPTFDDDTLKSSIAEKLEEYSEQNDIEADTESNDEVYNYISSTISISVVSVADKYVEKINTGDKLDILGLWFIPVIASVIFAAELYLINRKKPFSALLWVAGSVYFSSFTVHIVSALLLSKDYISNVSLSSSLLREMLLRIYRVFVGAFTTPSAIAAIISFAVLIFAIIKCAVPKKQDKDGYKEEESHAHTHTSSHAEPSDTEHKEAKDSVIIISEDE